MTRINIIEKNKDGTSPLHIASKYLNLSVCEILLKYCADPNAKNNDEHTILHCLCEVGSTGVTQLLLLHNATINNSNKCGCNPLHYASITSSGKLCEILIKSNVSMNQSDNLGKLHIHYAAEHRRTMVVGPFSGMVQIRMIKIRIDSLLFTMLLYRTTKMR